MHTVVIKSHFSTLDRIKELIRNLEYLGHIDPRHQVHISDIEFVTPLSITPVAAIINDRSMRHNYNGRNKSYLDTIRFPAGLMPPLQSSQTQKTYLPIIHLDIAGLDRTAISQGLNALATHYIDLLKSNVIADRQFIELVTHNTFGFLLGEMLDNIAEHALAKNVYLFAQYWPKTNSCEMCILDDGRGLYQSLHDAGRNVANSEDAIRKILETGLSAKNEFGDSTRGTGLRHTRAAITSRELNGEFLILSGDTAFYQSTNEGQNYIKFSRYFWRGVIILLKFTRPYTKFNIYDYIQ